MATPAAFQLRCPDCGATEYCSSPQMLHRLQQLGMLRRAADPERDLLSQLFVGAAGRFACASCARVGLAVAPHEEEDDWEDERLCRQCGAPIPGERVKILPDTQVCVACQQQGPQGEREFCPRCGAVMVLRSSQQGGITRYREVCPECRR